VSGIAGELRCALLEERGDALVGFAVLEQALDLVDLEPLALGEGQVEGGVDGLDDRGERGSGQPSELGRQLDGRRARPTRLDEPVDEPDRLRLLRGHLTRGRHDVDRPAPTDQPGKPLGTAAARDEPEAHFGEPVARVRTGHAQGGGHGQLQAPAQRDALDGGDAHHDGRGEALDGRPQAVAVGGEGRGVDGAQVLDVGARGEEAGDRRGQHQYAGAAALRLVEQRVQPVDDRRTERVGGTAVHRRDEHTGSGVLPGHHGVGHRFPLVGVLSSGAAALMPS
jgi:hypothetical protein